MMELELYCRRPRFFRYTDYQVFLRVVFSKIDRKNKRKKDRKNIHPAKYRTKCTNDSLDVVVLYAQNVSVRNFLTPVNSIVVFRSSKNLEESQFGRHYFIYTECSTKKCIYKGEKFNSI